MVVADEDVAVGRTTVPPPITGTVTTPEPTWENCSAGVSPPPLVGVAATTVGAHVLTWVDVGMIIGAPAGPTVWKAGITATTFPLSEQMVTCTCAGTSIGADDGLVRLYQHAGQL